MTTLSGRHDDDFYFADGATEGQRDPDSCSRSHSWYNAEPGFKPRRPGSLVLALDPYPVGACLWPGWWERLGAHGCSLFLSPLSVRTPVTGYVEVAWALLRDMNFILVSLSHIVKLSVARAEAWTISHGWCIPWDLTQACLYPQLSLPCTVP